MKLLLCVFVILFLTGTYYAQSPPTVRWEEGAANADRFISNGKTVKGITIDGLTLSVSLGQERLGSERVYYDKFVVYLYAVNLSDRRIEVSPDMVTVESLKPEAKILKREAAEHLANSIQKRTAFAVALGQFGADMQTTQSTTTGNANGTVYSPNGNATYSGTGTATTTSPDMEARRRANDQAAILNGSAAHAGVNLKAIELKANTIFPKQEYGGMLIFDRAKKCEEAIVRVAIDGKSIEFPFTWPKK